MTHRRLIVVLAVLCVTCKQAPEQVAKPATGGPQVRATVVTVRTALTPADRTYTHNLVIAKDRARDTGEQDVWRLYDLAQRQVTFVDSIARTYRTEPLASIAGKRQAAVAAAVPAHYPRATLRATNETKAMLGMPARQTRIELGAYRRELWLADHPAIPDELYAMIHMSDPPSSPLAPVTRNADLALASVRGFPFLDRAEITYGKTKHVVERTVIAVGQKDVPAALFEIPRDYEDVTPKPAPAATKKK